MREYNIYNENNEFQYFETLKKNRNKRHSCNEFFVEGVRNINECLKNKWEVSAVIYSKEATETAAGHFSDWAENILQGTALKYAKFYNLRKNLMQKLSEKQDKYDTSELIFIVKMKNELLEELTLTKKSTVLIFDRPSNKGNLGTVIRTCDAFGTDALIITGHAVDLYDSETVRASMGSFFSRRVLRVPSFNELTDWISKQKILFPDLQIIGTSAKSTEYITSMNLGNSPAVIMIGNETMGLSRNLYDLCGTILKIPMHQSASASSLNVACAATVILYQATISRL